MRNTTNRAIAMGFAIILSTAALTAPIQAQAASGPTCTAVASCDSLLDRILKLVADCFEPPVK